MSNGECLTSDGYALAIVADLGSGRIRIGYNSYPQPRLSFPPLLSTSQGVMNKQFLEGKVTQDLMDQDLIEDTLSDDCLALADFVNTAESSCSLVHCTNSDIHSNTRSTVPVNYSPPLVVIPPRHYSESKKCELLSILFSETSHESIAFIQAPSAHLFSLGKPSGLVLDSGGSITTCTAVWEGYSFSRTAKKSEFGGFDTSRLIKLLFPETVQRCQQFISMKQSDGYTTDYTRISYLDDLLLQQFKRQFSEVSCSFDELGDELRGNTLKEYELPDGHIVQAGVERFLLTEPLLVKDDGRREGSEVFSNLTELFHRKTQGKHISDMFHGTHFPSMIEDTCSSLDDHLQEHVRHTVMTCGGGISFIKHFNQRLKSQLGSTTLGEDISAAAERKFNKTCVISSQHRSESAWLGAALASSVPGFAELRISRKDVEEQGIQRMIARKCP
ncbi:actin superfamily [Perkinsela sp. CCAP 1560/4]|nr:actin superfamily [Perkinsela sp. CCAP 1560/4]|eukprot:KNH05283.1 actin superfamily [Perkinsela sp. CCAP 1560/4]